MSWCVEQMWLNYGGWLWNFWEGSFYQYDAWAATTQVCRLVIESA